MRSIIHSAASTKNTSADVYRVTPQIRTAIMGMGLEALRQYRREILDSAARHEARDVRVFDSMARGDDHESRDVDFLIDLETARTLLDITGFDQDVQQRLGRHVEVLTDGRLSPYLQQRICAVRLPVHGGL